MPRSFIVCPNLSPEDAFCDRLHRFPENVDVGQLLLDQRRLELGGELLQPRVLFFEGLKSKNRPILEINHSIYLLRLAEKADP